MILDIKVTLFIKIKLIHWIALIGKISVSSVNIETLSKEQIIAFLSFSILDGQFDFNISLLNDCLFGSIIGAISGIIAVNFGSGKNK